MNELGTGCPLMYRSSIVSKDGSVHGDVQCGQTKKKLRRKRGMIRFYLMSSDAFIMHKFVAAFTISHIMARSKTNFA
jgi:hypothetical protein